MIEDFDKYVKSLKKTEDLKKKLIVNLIDRLKQLEKYGKTIDNILTLKINKPLKIFESTVDYLIIEFHNNSYQIYTEHDWVLDIFIEPIFIEYDDDFDFDYDFVNLLKYLIDEDLIPNLESNRMGLL